MNYAVNRRLVHLRGARLSQRIVGALSFVLLALFSTTLVSAPPRPPTIVALDGETLGNVAVHDFTGLPMTHDGWTDMAALIMSSGYADARIVYVSNSGSDGTAQIYHQSSAELGGQPMDPVGPVAAYATLGTAYRQLREGYPDVMLLRRGDSWGESIDVLKKGRNAQERLIIAAYGPESEPRPVVGRVSQNSPGASAEFQILSSMRSNIPTDGSFWYSGNRILIEDFRWDSTSESAAGVLLALTQEGYNTVRRNTAHWVHFFSGLWAPSRPLPNWAGRIEENTLAKSPATYSGGARHNVYFAEDATNLQSIGNQSLETGGAGWRQRGGGLVHHNLLVGYRENHSNGYAGGFDLQQDIDAQYNVVLHAGASLDITAMLNATYNHNIISAQNRGFNQIGFHTQYSGQPGGHRGTNSISHNIVFGDQGISFPQAIVAAGLVADAVLTVSGNSFVRNGPGAVVDAVNDARVTYSENQYHSTSATANWFTGRTYSQMIPSTGSAVTPSDFPDPERNIITYMQSIGAPLASSWREAMGWYQYGVPGIPSLAGAVNNRRGAWDERFTAHAVNSYIRSGF